MLNRMIQATTLIACMLVAGGCAQEKPAGEQKPAPRSPAKPVLIKRPQPAEETWKRNLVVFPKERIWDHRGVNVPSDTPQVEIRFVKPNGKGKMVPGIVDTASFQPMWGRGGQAYMGEEGVRPII